MNKLELQKTANEIRKGIVSGVHAAKAGHPGGSLSAADIFTYLYFEEMNVDPKNPKDPDRDRFVLSKGHTAPGLYAALAEKGYFPKEDLLTLRHLGSYLQGHPDMKHIPGIDMSSGSLGQGLSAAAGMAAAGKFDKKDYRVYALCGDGEIREFAGTYSDYTAWKRDYEAAKQAAVAQEKAKSTASGSRGGEIRKSGTAPAKTGAARKLTFQEKREMEHLEAEIPELEQKKAAIEEKLSSGDLPFEELTALSEQITALMDQIDTKSMRWLELNEIGG